MMSRKSFILLALACIAAPAFAAAQGAEPAAPAAEGAAASSGQAASEGGFSAYAQGQMQENASITGVTASDDSVTVRFNEPGRLLGLFALRLPASATISADGRVALSHPWYAFLVARRADEAGLKTALAQEARVFNRSLSPASAGATSTARGAAALSASQKAQLLSGISMALAGALASPASTNL
jgi:hypothetical protein